MSRLEAGLMLAVWIVVVFGAAGLGSAATASSVRTWYVELNKPSFTPPSGVFGPVWTALYLMMAIAAWLVWLRCGFADGRLPLGLFAAQLVLNATWSILFFGLRSPGLAFAEIILLWAAILATLIAFWRAQPWAGPLLIPYLLWVSFAALLNGSIWWLNR